MRRHPVPAAIAHVAFWLAIVSASALSDEHRRARETAQLGDVDTGGAVIDVALDATAGSGTIDAVQVVGLSLPFHPGERVVRELAQQLSQRARQVVEASPSMLACGPGRYRVTIRFAPADWKRATPMRVIGIEPVLLDSEPGPQRVLIQGRIAVNGVLDDVSFEGAGKLQPVLECLVAHWRFRPLREPARFATILTVHRFTPAAHGRER